MGERAAPRRDLPSGTVTLLFADVEGSTRLLTLLGDRYLPVRTRSRELVREAAAAHGGREVDWAGDGVFLAFERAGDAVAAACDLQRALEAEPWPPGGAVRLRIGIHTGEPELDAEGYVGIPVVVAARICAAAHGGQVVVSSTARALAGDEPVPGGSLRPLGTFRLKDVPWPETLYQLDAPGLAASFPPLATLGGGTLPTLHHRLVGRTAQLAEITRLLADPGVRLVTITGVGGTGKSRLALEVASALSAERPVQLVGLAAISDAELVPGEISRALGVAEAPQEPLLGRIAGALRGTRTLLYLDNLEHLPQASAHVRELLDAVPDLDVLVTSRAPLRLSGEHVLPLDPLDPDEAVELFVELAAARSLRVGDDLLPTIRRICIRVDCLPLAIEVVAARLAVLSAGQLLEALDSDVALDLEAAADLPERQRTLRATLDWSYDLLTPAQQALHGALAVFAGGCTLEDARAVAGDPDRFLADLETLVLGSLVRGSAAAGQTRLVLLETVREHALGRLAAEGRLDDLRRRHADRFAALALEGAEGLEGRDHAAWADRLERELDNVRAALDWMLESGDVARALRTTATLSRFWRSHGHVTEARSRLALALERALDVDDSTRADALWAAARQAAAQSDWSETERLLQAALPLFRSGGRSRETAFTLAELAFVAIRLHEPGRAATYCEEALEIGRDVGDDRATSAALLTLGEIHSLRGEHAAALACLEEALALRRRLGDPLLVTDAVLNLGWVAFLGDDRVRARAAFEESLSNARELGDTLHTAEALRLLGELDLLEDDAESAAERLSESLELCTELGDPLERAACLTALAGVEALRGHAAEAARLFDEADALRDGAPLEAPERAIVERFGGAAGT